MQSKPQCSCTAEEVPCLCYDDKLQLTCEAEDTVDENVCWMLTIILFCCI